MIHFLHLQRLYCEPSNVSSNSHALSDYVHLFGDELAADLAAHSEHAALYQKITELNAAPRLLKDIQTIKQHAELLKLAANPSELAKWLKAPTDLLAALNDLKKKQEYAPIVSKMVVIALQLSSLHQINSTFTYRKERLTTLAHFVNANKIPLKDLNLSFDELYDIAPYLNYVDCSDVNFICDYNFNNFIRNCENVNHLIIKSKEIKDLNLVMRRNLKILECIDCTALKKLSCLACEPLIKISVTNCQELRIIAIPVCTCLTEININHCSGLQEILSSDCWSLTHLNVSNAKNLLKLVSNSCSSLTEINLSNCKELQELDCSYCPLLETIISTDLPNCSYLLYNGSPRIRQLPQLHPRAFVDSDRNIDFVSFDVHPDDLKTKPLQVLCHLGELILRDKRMPNIVYLTSEGIDAGGLRRQLVTTLMQNLFEKSTSPLKLLPLAEGVEGTLPLLAENDQQQFLAFKTVGALIALAAKGSLPLGRFLRRGLFHALLTLEENELKTLEKNLEKTLEKKIYSLATYGIPDADCEAEHPIALPIAHMSMGFREIADPAKFRDHLSEFINLVAGKEATWDNFDHLSLYSRDDHDLTKGYFKTFFEKQPHRINDMIELFTASRTLGVENIKIIIDSSLNQNNLFEITTCFQQVKIPPYDTYELFEAKLLKTIEHSSGQFGRC